MSNSVKVVGGFAFVDRVQFVQMDSAKMTESLMNMGVLMPVVVDSLTQFFSRKNLERALAEPNEYLEAMLLARGVKLTDEDLTFLKAAAACRKRIMEQVVAAQVQEYPFAEVPDGWVLADEIRISKTVAARGGYQIGLKTLKRIWDAVSPVWAGYREKPRGSVMNITTGGYNRNVEFERDDVLVIGCQTIARYELEQVALNQGWPLPQPE